MSTIERKPFAERCSDECTRDVIFLFQRRRWNLHDYDHPERDVLIPMEKIHAEGWEFGDWDHPCVTESWHTEGVYLTREEATAYGKRRDYNFADGWRVYGVCAEGELVELIKNT